ncbi:MAG TPA: TonB-dependent receptor [Polyangiales bacterium]|nr:TonB-dependent receptor [Polyangiales bacterium]
MLTLTWEARAQEPPATEQPLAPEAADAAPPPPAAELADAGPPDAEPPPAADGGIASEAESDAAPTPPPEATVLPPEEATPTAGLEEIVVTATRRRTKLQQTPISITAHSGESLRERGVVDLEGVAEATPNMQITTSGNGSGGSSFAQVFIRGVGQPDFIITKDPAVGIYVDGVYLARAPGALLELLDIERIEVLRGPQGTLFGKNTAGGAINVITKQPENAFSGVAELRAGDYGRRDITGAFQAPLVEDRLFLRVAGMALNTDGYYERIQPSNIDERTEDGNNAHVYSGRASLRWAATDDVDVVIAADTTLQRETATDYQAVGIFDSPNISLYNRLVLAPLGQKYDSKWIAPEPWTTYSTSPSYNNTDVWGTSGTITWDIGPVQLKSITAYRALRVATKTDADGTPFDIVASDGILVEQNQISQELQVSGRAWDSRINWLLGLWYFQEHAKDTQSSRQLVGLFEALEDADPRSIDPPGMTGVCPPDGNGPPQCLGGMGNMANLRFDQTRLGKRDLKGRSYAAFGHGSARLIDGLTLTAGARISREEKEFTYYETRPLQDDLVSFDNVRSTPSWNVFTPKVGLEYQFTQDLMAYTSWSLGFKAGGVNGRPARSDLFTSFDPEWLSTWEVGAKTDWFDKRLRVNVAGFYSRYTDIQITRNTVDSNGAFIRVEQNAGDARIFGFETELSAAPTRDFQLGGGVGYTNFHFTSLLPQMAAPGTPLLTLENKLPFTPVFLGTGSASYRVRMGEAGSLTPRVDFSYSSGYFIDIDNTQGVEQEPFAMLHARLTYAPESAKWELFAAVTNITQQAVIASGVASPANGSQIVSYRPPRMFYGGARFIFD